MSLEDIWQAITNPQLWPLFLTFLGGYVMMNVLLGHRYVKKNFSELEKTLIAFGIGFLFEYFLFLPLFLLADFWFTSLGANVYVSSAVVFCAVSAGAMFIAIYVDDTKKLVEGTKKLLMGLIAPFSAFVLLSFTIGWTVRALYPYYVAVLILTSWQSFVGLALTSFLMFLSVVFFLWVYVLKFAVRVSLKDQTLGILKKLRKRTILGIWAAVIAVLVIGLLVVPLDMSFGLFTPRMQQGAERFSPAMATGRGFYRVVFINATRGAKENVSATYRYYALMSTSYNITLPWRCLLSSLYVSNPSNASFLMGEGNYPSLPTPTEGWEKIYVTLPNNVTYKPSFAEPPNANEVTGLTISFGNFSGEPSFLTSLAYWQETSTIENVEISYNNLAFTDLGNGSWMEAHTINIKNNSNDTLDIPALEYDRFIFDYVIRNSTRVYLNGNPQPWGMLMDDTRLSVNAWIGPQMESNLTFTFLITQNPSP